MADSIHAKKSADSVSAGVPHPGELTNYRWIICALLFFATTINYIDRQILSLLKEVLDKEIGWTNEQFGFVNSVFQLAYGVGLLGFGWFVDRFGTKVGYAVSIASLEPGGRGSCDGRHCRGLYGGTHFSRLR